MPYYIGDLKRDPNLENYPFEGCAGGPVGELQLQSGRDSTRGSGFIVLAECVSLSLSLYIYIYIYIYERAFRVQGLRFRVQALGFLSSDSHGRFR